MHVSTRMIHATDAIEPGCTVAYIGPHEAMKDLWGIQAQCKHVLQSYVCIEYGRGGAEAHVHVSELVRMERYQTEVSA